VQLKEAFGLAIIIIFLQEEQSVAKQVMKSIGVLCRNFYRRTPRRD
jgi:hypothetical protein